MQFVHKADQFHYILPLIDLGQVNTQEHFRVRQRVFWGSNQHQNINVLYKHIVYFFLIKFI